MGPQGMDGSGWTSELVGGREGDGDAETVEDEAAGVPASTCCSASETSSSSSSW